MASADSPYVTCGCCQLLQPRAVDRVTGVTARVCDECTHHQGDQDATRLRRAEAHVRMLRERLEKCRASEAAARREVAGAREAARDARAQTAAALASRAGLAARIVDAAAETNHRCAVTGVARALDVISWARQAGRPDPRGA